MSAEAKTDISSYAKRCWNAAVGSYLTVARPPISCERLALQEGAGATFKPADLEALLQSFVSDANGRSSPRPRNQSCHFGAERKPFSSQRFSSKRFGRPRRAPHQRRIPASTQLGLPQVLKEVACSKRADSRCRRHGLR